MHAVSLGSHNWETNLDSPTQAHGRHEDQLVLFGACLSTRWSAAGRGWALDRWRWTQPGVRLRLPHQYLDGSSCDEQTAVVSDRHRTCRRDSAGVLRQLYPKW